MDAPRRPALAICCSCGLLHIFRDEKLARESSAGFEIGLELGDPEAPGIFEFLVGVEGRGVCCGIEVVGTAHKGRAQSDRRGILDLQVQLRRRGEDSIMGWRICDRVSDDFPDLDAARLMQEQHLAAADGKDKRLCG